MRLFSLLAPTLVKLLAKGKPYDRSSFYESFSYLKLVNKSALLPVFLLGSACGSGLSYCLGEFLLHKTHC